MQILRWPREGVHFYNTPVLQRERSVGAQAANPSQMEEDFNSRNGLYQKSLLKWEFRSVRVFLTTFAPQTNNQIRVFLLSVE